MWCSQCNEIFEENLERCPRCGGALEELPTLQWGRTQAVGKTFDRWPKDENGEPERPAFLRRCKGLDLDDQMLVTMLEAFGIVCLRGYPDDGEFGRLILGLSGTGVDIYVPESQLEDARALIEGASEEHVEL